MNYKKVFKRETKVIAYVVIALTLVVIGTSYALFLQVNNNQDNQVVTAGSLVVTYSNGNVVTVEENDENNCLIPQSDTDAITGGCKFTLSVTNTGSLPMQYDLLIYDDVNNEELPSNAKFVNHDLVRHSLNKQYSQEGANRETVTDAASLGELELKEDKRILESSMIGVGETITFSLNIWISEEATVDIIGQYVYLKLDVVGSVYEDNHGMLKYFAKDSTEAFYQNKNDITKIVFENKLEPKVGASSTFDVSEAQDKSVMAYLVSNDEDNTKYTLYLQGEDKIRANPNSSYLFYNFENLENIEGLEYFDTSNVTDMQSMFAGNTNLISLDLSHFNTNKVINMLYIFHNCENLISLDISNFNKNVNKIDNAFLDMPSNAKVYVKDGEMRTWVLNSKNRPKGWTTDNILIK